MLAGCIQVPMAFAGPLLIDGEGMRPGGEQVFVPLATSEGALVASYNRGMRLTREAGGVKTTVIDDQMQRAPCFMFSDARYAKAFGAWIGDNFAMIKTKAESTSRYACLIKLEHFPVGRARHIRFCYATGDAAGQNMTSKATREACLWILSQNPAGLDRFYLSGNMDTDKKHSHLNIMSARGKKVVAECTIPADTFHRIMGASVKQIYQASKISTFGSLYANSSGNGAHIANAVTAIFIG